MPMRDLILLMGPPNPRHAAVIAAATAAGLRVRDASIADIAPDIASFVARLPSGSIIRLDAMGGDTPVRHAMLVRAMGADQAVKADHRRGIFHRQGRIAAGYALLLHDLADALAARPDIQISHAPQDVALLQNKPATAAHLAAHGIPVAPQLGQPMGLDDVVAAARAGRHNRVFLKLAQGSSGAGCMALSLGPNGQMIARTTLHIDADGTGWNTRRLVTTHDPAQIRAIAGMICAEGATAEAELPRLRLDGKTCDIRIITVAGRADWAMLRLSDGPITNLHLLNHRADAAQLQELIGADNWRALLATAEATAALFPACLSLGIDMAIAPDHRRHAVIEVNAFGDFVKGAVNAQGQTPHDAQMQHLARRMQHAEVVA